MANFNNGTITITVSGGTAPFIYTLLDVNGDAVLDSAYTNFTNVQTSNLETFTFGDAVDTTGGGGLDAGVYSIKSVDINGCIVHSEQRTIADYVIPSTYNTLSSNINTVSEGSDVAFTLTSTAIADGATVGYTLSGIDANDITGGLTGTFTMASDTASVVITTVADSTTEGPETMIMTLDATDNGSVSTGSMIANVTILDTSEDPVLSYNTLIPSVSTTNEGTNVTFALNSSNIVDGTTVGYTLSGIDANDITGGLTGTFTMASDLGDVTISILNDSLTEGPETMLMTLDAIDSAGTSAGLTASVDITDTSETLSYDTLIPTPSTTDEGTNVTFTLNSSNIVDGTTVGYTITGIDANDTSDSLTGTFTMASDLSDVTISILNDNLTEGPETMLMALDAIDSVGTSAGLTASVNINDTSEDPLVLSYDTLTPNGATWGEGQDVIFTLDSSNIVDGTTVGYTLSGISAADVTGGLTGTFTMNNNTDDVTISIVNDNLSEGLETMLMTLDAIDSVGTSAGLTASVDINDTSQPILSYDTLTVQSQIDEGTMALFTVNTSNIVDGTTVGYTLTGIDANDIVGNLTGTLTINTNTAQIGVAVVNDNLTEGPETMLMTLDAIDSAGTSAGLTASVDINDTSEDLVATFVLTSSPGSMVSEGSDITWTLTTTNVVDATTVPFTLGGSATIVDDYTDENPKEFTIISGSGTYTVTTIADLSTVPENEAVSLTLAANDSAGNATGSLTKSVTINNTSQGPVYHDITGNSTFAEGGTTIIVTLNTENVVVGTEVGYTLTGTALEGTDYPTSTGILTINGDSENIDLGIAIADLTSEGPETAVITLDATDNAGTSTGSLTKTITITDDSITPQYQFIATPTDNMPNSFMAVAQYYGEHFSTFNGTMVDAGQNSFDHVYVYPADGYIYSNQNQVLLDPGTLTIPLGGDGNPGSLVNGLGGTAPDGSRKQGVRFLMMKGNIQSAWTANISATDANGGPDRMYQSLTGPATWAEGQASNGIVTLNTAGISDAAALNYPNGVTCGYTITGSATGGGVDYGAGGIINPVVLTTDAVDIDFGAIVADLLTEGAETVTITLDDFDSIGNPTFGLTKTVTISDDSETAPAILGYYFHGGQGNYPANSDLTNGGFQTYYHNPGGGFAPTNDFDVAMSYVMDNGGTLGNGTGSDYAIEQFTIPTGGIPALGNSDVLSFAANQPSGENYYVILPDGQVDLTDFTQMHLYHMGGGANTNAAAKKSFTWNGNLYWIYRLGFANSSAANAIAFNDSNVA